jgi:hypothetical protein
MRHPSPTAPQIAFLMLSGLVFGGANCDSLALDTGAADVTLTVGEEEPLRLVHDATLSQIALTPPVEGEVELTFAFQDPLVDLTLRVNANEVSEGDRVELPVAPEQLFLSVQTDTDEYVSTDGSSGTVELLILFVDEDAGAAEVNAQILTTLVSSDPMSDATVDVDGFVEARVGLDASAL